MSGYPITYRSSAGQGSSLAEDGRFTAVPCNQHSYTIMSLCSSA